MIGKNCMYIKIFVYVSGKWRVGERDRSNIKTSAKDFLAVHTCTILQVIKLLEIVESNNVNRQTEMQGRFSLNSSTLGDFVSQVFHFF